MEVVHVKNAFKKLKNAVGFTLAETLLAVLIMLLVSGIVAAGIPAARSAYERVILASNADLLLSTTVSYLRSELSAAGKVETSKFKSEDKVDTVITYYNKTSNAMSKIWIDNSKYYPEVSTIKYQRYSSSSILGIDNPDAMSETVDLISPKASTADLYIIYQSVEYQDNVLTFHNLQVKRRSGAAALAIRPTFSIWVLEY